LRKKRKKNQKNWQKEKEKRDWFRKLSKGGLSRIWVIKKYGPVANSKIRQVLIPRGRNLRV
jgi:hypothetical protein